jgi:methionyl-tRNA formyltransferase
MANYIIVSEKKWNDGLRSYFERKYTTDNWFFFSKKEDVAIDNIVKINPEIIFFPHWSYIIQESVFSSYTCIVFHMTDIPFGRGGSPLQNLIVRGFENTVVSAVKVCKNIDAGDIYIKEPLCLHGTAEEIFMRANNVIKKMMERIITENITPQPQSGEAVIFKRRTPEESNIENLNTIEKIYDHIRMLDAEGYPHAFLEHDNIRLEFSRASIKADGTIRADVKINLIK